MASTDSNGIMTIDALMVTIERLKYDIDQTVNYIDKLRTDRAKMNHTLQYNTDNLDYLRTHCGVIAIDYVKSIRNQIKRLRVFLDHVGGDIEKFEIVLTKQKAELERRERELEELKLKMASKVVKFRGREK